MTLSSFETPWARVPISIPLHVPDAVIAAGSRFRISFFGDLVKVLVKDGQGMRAGQLIATVDHFFHFGVGYRRFDPREEDIFVDPFKLFPGRAALPSDMIRRARSR